MFKKQKHHRFDYKPRYYDEDKEELKKRVILAERVHQGDTDAVRERIASTFQRRQREKSGQMSSFVLLMVLALITVGVLIFIKFYLSGLVDMFT